MPKWIEFRECPSRGITKAFIVANIKTLSTLGVIKWYAPFRKYSFYPYANMVFDATCLKDITDFINQLEAERKDLIKYNQVRKILLKD
jgi:hypothetical protein